MGETEEITVECPPAGSLQLIDRFGGYDFLFVSFSPKKGPVGGIPSQDQFFLPKIIPKLPFNEKFSTKCKTPDSRYAAKMQELCQKIRKMTHNLKKSE